MLKVNDVLTDIKDGKERYLLVVDRPYDDNKDYLLKEISFNEAMSHKEYRLVFDDLPENYILVK